MASWAKRLTSLAAAFALSGAPAVLSACMALCLQVMPAAAAAQQPSVPVDHAAHTTAHTTALAAAPATAAHAHHASSAVEASTSSADERTAPDAYDARISAACDNCCPDGAALVANARVERTNAHGTSAVPLPSSVPSFFVTMAVSVAAPHGPPVPPPSPVRAAVVLRI